MGSGGAEDEGGVTVVSLPLFFPQNVILFFECKFLVLTRVSNLANESAAHAEFN